jgi:hypothetical protein
MTTTESETTTREGGSVTPVILGGTRGGPSLPTLRTDRWWIQPIGTALVLTLFIGYSTWAIFVNRDYYTFDQQRNLISPFFSPCIASACSSIGHPGDLVPWWKLSPALLVAIFPLGFRATCYYYRKSYYRSFWFTPPACGVVDNHSSYSGETKFPLILQNIHRYFLYFAAVVAAFLTADAVTSFRWPGDGIGVSVGTLVLIVNASLIWLYVLSCHACRHLCGGNLKHFSNHPIRHWIWRILTPLNSKHMVFAWLSLVFIVFTDLYVRLVASGAIHDFGVHL